MRDIASAALLLCGMATATAEQAIPRPQNVVIVVEENRAYSQVIGVGTPAPYINSLARRGALFTNSFAVAHPSQPNYLALFSGSTHGVTDNHCLLALSGENLASELRRKGLSFAVYSESMPTAGFAGCAAAGGRYAREHNPAVNWQGRGLPVDVNLPFSAFPSDLAKLPTVSLVVPDLSNDMHDGKTAQAAIARGDAWLKEKLDRYVRWAERNDSLLILTFDEDDGSADNRIVTLFIGPMVKPGRYPTRIDHYRVLRTLAEMYGLAPPGNARSAAPIREVWKPPARRSP